LKNIEQVISACNRRVAPKRDGDVATEQFSA
jgi:hypothetical protein